MGKILVISSFVTHGSVGLQAAVPALSACGHDVIAFPTVILSTHPGYGRYARQPVSPDALCDMLEAHKQNGLLDGIAAILTGYLPEAGHVNFACQAVQAVKRRSPRARFVCDPVAGDDPNGHYLRREASETLQSKLLPLAEVATPNRYELSWYSGQEVGDIESAQTAARELSVPIVVATSIPDGEDRVATVLVTGSDVFVHADTLLRGVPHGTGDVLSALITGQLASGASPHKAVAAAQTKLLDLINRSTGRKDLDLTTLHRPGGG